MKNPAEFRRDFFVRSLVRYIPTVPVIRMVEATVLTKWIDFSICTISDMLLEKGKRMHWCGMEKTESICIYSFIGMRWV